MLAFNLPFFFVLLFSTTSSQPYIPTDHFFLSCGSSTATNSTYEQGSWDGDEHSKFVPSNITTTSFSSIPDNLDPSVPQVPYSTARIFNTCSFTYTFPVSSQGPKYLRLHFYPATYSGLHTEQSFFSVSSNGYSLLTNFSAFLAASFMAKSNVVKEFLIYVKDTQILNVTFTPSPNAYAFINGIEIVSMPEHLYFNAKMPKYVNGYTGPFINMDTALENVYRLNMGGGEIPGNDDTGMYRSWEQDNNYLYGGTIGLTSLYNNPIMYTTETPNYTAPETVYQTQRSMGNQSDKYNLTWIFPVDSGFYYMLRLHFCNIIPQYTEKGDVRFRIFINNQTAEQYADVFRWTQGSGYPVYKDYIVFVNDTDGHRSIQDLWLAMHPNPSHEESGDAYLNGLEAFKLSVNGNLSSPNPELSPDHLQPSVLSATKGEKKNPPFSTIFGVVGGCLVLLLSILILLVFRRQRRVKHLSTTKSSWGQTSSDTILRCRRFTLQEVKMATDEFNDNCSIGSGGFGKVYKGYMDNATTIVAIKRLNPSSSQGPHEFLTEISLLSKISHVHLVSMIGYCVEDGEMLLVYDYMAHGTLQEHLYNTSKPPLSWKRRLDICIGAAKGLNYLHSMEKRAIIHRDVKDEQVNLAEWGKNCHRKGTLEKIIDPKLSGEIAPRCLRKFGEVASSCLHEVGSERPAMEEVVWGTRVCIGTTRSC
ncbi:putative protein kinase RLK-Pelle-CrRLK1L-1 family [Helianthus annuus]|nr:putative protein kinase RLK-Pelle-CrRLK1L-1 family [Helianthus annuus]